MHSSINIAFRTAETSDEVYAQQLQSLLEIPTAESGRLDEFTHLLLLDETGLSLQSLLSKSGAIKRLPTRVDFADPTLNYRRQTSGKQQGIAKAVGLNRHEPMHVLDLTAGLGKDAFILASLGCRLTMLESSPLIFSLLNDGLLRAKQSEDAELREIVERMVLHHVPAEDWLQAIDKGESPKPDVIYLDPMFPARNQQAAVKRDISLLQEVLPVATEPDTLLEAAIACKVKRVVLKQPGSKPSGKHYRASFIVPGKSAYFEIFS
jgi:16S rRNA (guanine1516-N2)-methyltransferase